MQQAGLLISKPACIEQNTLIIATLIATKKRQPRYCLVSIPLFITFAMKNEPLPTYSSARGVPNIETSSTKNEKQRSLIFADNREHPLKRNPIVVSRVLIVFPECEAINEQSPG